MQDDERSEADLPLAGLRVIDASSIFAGPLVATLLGDFGADVIKIEHPTGDSLRKTGLKKDGVPLWWKVVSRNKRCISLNIKQPRGQEIFKRLVADADVLIENFRTGTLEKWGIGWDVLSALNPRLVMVRVTGFGQTGPYRRRAGFGTLAEAMSGFAHITGEPDGPPTLPPFGLADGIAANYGAFATMFALYERDAPRNGKPGSGKGQYIDLALYEPLFSVLGAQPTVFDQLGEIQQRSGNRSVNNVPRNAYQTKEGRWVALSTSAESIVFRVLRLCGGEEAANDPRWQTAEGRMECIDEIDDLVGGWIARHSLEEVLDAFEKAEAAIGPVYDVEQLMNDRHVQERGSITEIQDPDLGPLKMQSVFPILSRTPGRIRHAGPRLGQHNDEILRGELGLSTEELDALKAEGIV